MQACLVHDLSKAHAFGMQRPDAVEPCSRSGVSPLLDETVMLCHLWRPVAVNESGRFREAHRLARRKWQRSARGADELLFGGVAEVLQQVEAVSDLPSLGCPSGSPQGIQTTTVTAHHFDRRMLLEPTDGRVSGPVLQDI
jgi:hypothetical protein